MKMWRIRRRNRKRKKEEKLPRNRIFQRKFVHLNMPFIESVK
jgi:hypothetical protein